ncbi:MAG: hypothetical protein HYV35_10590, partial [Lentisphaerae bacterium]|nr:hypothetical protein [Lentisphaerota bacterium]
NGDDVIITNLNIGVRLTNATPSLASILLSNKCTLIFSNWDTSLTATNVTIRTNAVMTLPAAFSNGWMSNRVWIICSNLSVVDNGKIDVDGKGYMGAPSGSAASGSGPGGGSRGYSGTGHGGGGGYGGRGGRSLSTASRGAIYGSSNAPVLPGSGGGAGLAAGRDGTRGGGLIWINATDTITLNGSLLADGETIVNGYGGAGSGGGIYLRCLTFAGGSNGLLRAKGGSGGGNQGGGGGGRIAVWRRADRHFFQGSYSVTNGTSYTTDAEVGTVFLGVIPPPGTIVSFR